MKTPKLCPSQAQIFSVLKTRPKRGFTRRELEEKCNRRSGPVCARVDELRNKGLLETCGHITDPVTKAKGVEVVRVKQ